MNAATYKLISDSLWNNTEPNNALTENVDENTTLYQIVKADEIHEINFCNKTTHNDKCGNLNYDVFEASVVGVLCLLIVVTVIGNTLIISAVVTTKRLRTVTNCFVTSLAVADLLVGEWELGWILCDIWISLDILLCTASILSLCAISIDRYLAVTRPLTYSRRRRSKKLALTMILFVWVVAGAITYEPDHNQGGVCRYNQNPGYVVFSAMGSFFLPMIVMVYVYARISCVVARRHQQLASTTKSDSGSDKHSLRQTASKQTVTHASQQIDNTTQTEQKCPCCFRTEKKPKAKAKEKDSKSYSDVQFKSNFKYKDSRRATHSVKDAENNRVSSLRRETKTAQTLSFVVGGFIACWLPFFVYYILTPFIPSNYVNEVLMYILTWLGWFNSAINPFIYAFYSPDFRLAFWRLTFRKCKRNKRRI
ncbi:unnamed protein product, partial [Leptidea sinapis]